MQIDLASLQKRLEELAGEMKTQHLLLAKGLVSGKTQADAYRASGGKSKDPSNSANVMIQRNSSITEYVEISAQIVNLKSQDEVYATFDQKKRMLWDAAQRCMQEVEPEYAGRGDDKQLVGYVFDVKGMTGCVSELNRMDGDHAAIKTDNRHNFDDLSDDEIDKKLAAFGATPAESN